MGKNDQDRVKPKYIIRPSTMVSRNDGQRHYIDATRLAELYQVDLRECVVIYPDERIPRQYMELEILAPRYDGKYYKPL